MHGRLWVNRVVSPSKSRPITPGSEERTFEMVASVPNGDIAATIPRGAGPRRLFQNFIRSFVIVIGPE
jgi:hypothetical protein